MYEEEKKRMLTGNHGDQGEGRKKGGKVRRGTEKKNGRRHKMRRIIGIC